MHSRSILFASMCMGGMFGTASRNALIRETFQEKQFLDVLTGTATKSPRHYDERVVEAAEAKRLRRQSRNLANANMPQGELL